MRFSDRTPMDLSLNLIAQAREKLSGESIIDLTESNPTLCGFHYPPDLLAPLGRSENLVYEPEPFGSLEARESVAGYLGTRGQKVDPHNLLLTASTSEAYSFLFKLLGNPGDSFMGPTPGYPLLDHLLFLESLTLIPYQLQPRPGWPLDRPSLGAALRPSCRGLVVVNPNNPTGSFLNQEDAVFLGKFCQSHNLAYISDEVFSDYAYSKEFDSSWAPQDNLSFHLGGLSKSLGLPQLKLSWILMEGPPSLLNESRKRLELIADTYLSVNTPTQFALKDLFKFAPVFQKQLKERVLANQKSLIEGLKGVSQVHVWPSQGGWYALVEVTYKKAQEEGLVLELLEKRRVFVQPGGFYDFPGGCFLVLSLLPLPEKFREGVLRIRKFLQD